MAIQCQYSVVTTVQNIKWGSMYTGTRTHICCKSTVSVLIQWTNPCYDFWGSTVSDTWQLLLNEKVADEEMNNITDFFYNLEPKHLQNALWSCQNSIKTFISTLHKSPFPFWLTTVCQKWKVLCLWLHSRSLQEPWVATTVSKVLPWVLANGGSAFSYTQQHQA